MNDFQDKVAFYTQQLSEVHEESDEAKDFKILIATNRRNYTNEHKQYDSVKRIYDYLQSVVDNLKVAETCPICLDDTDVASGVAVTKCGHKFCWDCIQEYFDTCNAKKCPKCNVEISKSNIFLLKNETSDQVIEATDSDLTQLIEHTKSTKIGNVIHFIQTKLHPDDKCIIFSQWDTMLHKVGDYLTKQKINVVYCKGTVFQRNSAIKDFTNQKSKTNIILLSSKNAASGINLTVANKIILIEPVYGTKEYRDDIENQSIGRVDRLFQKKAIEVFRFIIKDTIEEEICGGRHEQQIEDAEFRLENDLNILEL
jgi:SNF2 family DNA or RNA helicase